MLLELATQGASAPALYTPRLDEQPARGSPRAWEHVISDEESLVESVGPSFPSKVGAYRVDGRLGAGGMDEVYRGWDDKLERPVALKRVAPDAADAEGSRELFRREAREVARLHHGSIVQVFELIEDEDGDWLVLELVEGKSLRQLCGGRKIKPSRVIEIGRGICAGLTAAHDAGIVHRDLKLDNVMLTATGEVKILDFGIYKRLAPDDGAAKTETLSTGGRLVGTVTAMSPEQAAGGEIDHRSDLFSLGSLLYELLTGKPPFLGKNSHETLSRICLHKETPAEELVPEVPESLSLLVGLLLEKDPARRPQSAEQARQALAEISAEMSGVVQRLDPSTWTGETEPFRTDPPVSTPSGPTVRTLLLNDLVDSTKLVEKLGDERAARIFELHDRKARELLKANNGREIDKSDGFLMLFERPMDAVRFALGYHAALEEISEQEGVVVSSRVGIHVGEVVLRVNSPEDVARGAKPLEVEGLAKAMAARLMTLAGARQTLISRGVFDLGKRAAVGAKDLPEGLRWVEHGRYTMKGVGEPVRVFEVGVKGASPLAAPADSKKVKRVVEFSGRLSGWRLRAAVALVLVLVGLAGLGLRQLWLLREVPPPMYMAVPQTTIEAEPEQLAGLRLKAGAVHAGLLRALLGYRGIAALEPTSQTAEIEDPMVLARTLGVEEILTSRLVCEQSSCQIILKRFGGENGALRWNHRFTDGSESLLDLTLMVMDQLRGGYSELELRGGVPDLKVLAEDYESYLDWFDRYYLWDGFSVEEAFEGLAAIHRTSPRFLEAYLLEASISRRRFVETRQAQDLERALAATEHALSLASEDPRTLTILFDIQLDVGNLEEAALALDRLEQIERGDARVLSRRARLLELQGALDEALRRWQEVVRSWPSWRRYSNLAAAATRMGDLDLARQSLESMLERSPPNNFDALSRLAQLELLSGSPERSAELYESLVSRRPDETELTNLGVAYLLLRRYDDAAGALERALEQAPRSPFALLNLGDAELLRGSSAAATELYEQVLEQIASDPNPDVLLTVEAQALAQLGRFEEAIARVQKALRNAPENPQTAFEAALVYTLAGEETSALLQARRALEGGVDERWFGFRWFDPLRERLQKEDS